VDARGTSFQHLFKSLIRYHYHEWQYNSHWGGGELESLFHSENPILQHRSTNSTDGIVDVVDAVAEKPYENYNEGISLFSGFDEFGSRNPPMPSISSETYPVLARIAQRLESENYFNIEEELTGLLEDCVRSIDVVTPVAEEFLRARIGVNDKKIPLHSSFEPEYHYRPFQDSDISAPPPLRANAGRINRSGVAYFYAATDAPTAIAEVRPYPGDLVSLGRFRTKRALRIADFSKLKIEQFSHSDKALDEFRLLHTIKVLLNKPVSPEYRSQYCITQLVADTLRQMGYDGVRFLSSVGDGHNLTVFRPELMEYIAGKGMVYQVRKLKYDVEKKVVAREADEYF